MLRRNSTTHQPNLFGTDFLMQLDVTDPLLKLAVAIPWQEFERSGTFSQAHRCAGHGEDFPDERCFT